MNLQKRNPERSRKYLDWVKSLPCISTLRPADDPHHIKIPGLGGSVKCSDFFTIPLCREAHDAGHKQGWNSWDMEHAAMHQPMQCEGVIWTLDRALHEGVITIEVNL